MTLLDVGLSTGAFSDYFIQVGAAEVTGMDIASEITYSEGLASPRFRFF